MVCFISCRQQLMFTTYLILWYRRMMRQKALAAINIAGLSIGLSGALLIYLYVSHELSFDQFHEKADRIFRVYCAHAKPGETPEKFPYTPPVLSGAVRSGIPGLEASARVWEMGDNVVVGHEQSVFSEPGVLRVDSGFFHIFSGGFLAGRPGGCLARPQTIVLARTTAEKYFGSPAEALNKTLTVRSYAEEAYTVTAVVEDFPSTSHIQFNALLSVDYSKETYHPDNWLSHDPFTYVLLAGETEQHDVEERMRQMTEHVLEPIYLRRYGKTYAEQKQAGGLQEYRLQPLKDVRLYSGDMNEGAGIRTVYILGTIGVMLILLAGFNYVNLATARSAWDAKNAGIRKVLGSTSLQLYKLFLTESAGMSLLASFLAIALAQTVLSSDYPITNAFLPHKTLPVDACLILTGLSIGIGLLSGVLPAKLVSGFEPTRVIKGQFARGNSGHSLRRVLVVAQFIGSMTLVMCTFLISGQLNFMQSKALGFQKERLLVVNNVDELGNHQQTFKEMLGHENFAMNASLCYGMVGNPGNSAAFTPVELIERGREDIVIGIPVYIGDEDYLNTLGVKLLMGHAFPAGLARENQQIILNREALRSVGWKDRKAEDVIGKMIDVNGLRYEMAGVVEDYHFQSLHQRINPMAILSHYYQGHDLLMLRIRPGTTQQAIQAVERHWRKMVPDIPLEYSFVEDDLRSLYASEHHLGLLFRSFAGLAIFIACLGLLGLAMFSAERRVKEIGIRKVLGASVPDIVVTLSRDMVTLITMAFLLATPVSWYLMETWLENFAYRIDIKVWTFLWAGGFTLLIALLTISYQSIKAALSNPAESLRHE